MPTDPDAKELRALSTIVGAPVVAAERSAWGFENRTDIVTLADGRRLVVQRITKPSLARQKLRLARTLPDRLAAAGLRIPRVLAADATADPPYAVREYLPGAPGSTLMGSDDGAILLAAEMGAILRRLALVPTEGARLHSGWADPARLARQARRWLDRCRALLGEAEYQALAATIAEVPARFAGRPAQFAHGDFCPVNALVEGGRVVALLDVEFARVADPLFDAAWWGWVVRAHHPARWIAAWPRFLERAGIPADADTLHRIGILQRLRCLELLDDTITVDPARTALWQRRLIETMGWD